MSSPNSRAWTGARGSRALSQTACASISSFCASDWRRRRRVLGIRSVFLAAIPPRLYYSAAGTGSGKEATMEAGIERLTALAFIILGLSHAAAPRTWIRFFLDMRAKGDIAGILN